ncbi:cytochrome c oxidase subunit II [Alkalilimnicola ehrlichii]|uniref:Cytochrome c oxidase subunit 2 n=1 Tax=Alkalilimnicola ehrlichii TaxID=351052 RepID=A0A3E0X1K1_9GAMM|nr:cytochrome c oxidase subunit II [Alkalilimnicola ehrlichii]RFA31182.1 cytochrome c oxidase subunit II [Alkalilimnicola ehrlichii]RFA39533.1 cytochrome c oxidase subunit II [Alkalilimnicola ehrlichii]
MKVTKRLGARLGLGLGLLLAAGPAAASWGMNLTRGVTSLSQSVYDLHMLVLWICVVIGTVVFGLILWSVIHHRKSRGVTAAQFHHSTAVEIAWTVVPMLILIAMAIPATRVLVAMHDTGDADVTIKVTGYQWMWEYEYIDEDIQFFSRLDRESDRVRQLRSGLDPREVENYLLNVDKPLVVPVNQKIRFLLTANDVIHSFWVPDLGWKRDAIPGFINEAWAEIQEPGIYRGQCAELCGRDHAFMPIVVIAKSQEDYEAWIAEQRAEANGVPEVAAEEAPVEEAVAADMDMDDLMQRGEDVYGAQCAACHQADGRGNPPMFPTLAGSDFVVGPAEDVIDIVLNGQGAMPPLGGVLDDADVASVVTYIRNAFGNETGDVVQPADVQAAR